MAPWGYDLDIGEVRWTKQLYRQLNYDSLEQRRRCRRFASACILKIKGGSMRFASESGMLNQALSFK